MVASFPLVGKALRRSLQTAFSGTLLRRFLIHVGKPTRAVKGGGTAAALGRGRCAPVRECLLFGVPIEPKDASLLCIHFSAKERAPRGSIP